VTEEQADELRLAEAKVRALLRWDLTHETVDVAMQVREMLEQATLDLVPEIEQISDGGSVKDDMAVTGIENIRSSVSGSLDGEQALSVASDEKF
jgi:hypothetical protein